MYAKFSEDWVKARNVPNANKSKRFWSVGNELGNDKHPQERVVVTC